MNYKRINELITQINELSKELEKQKRYALKRFKGMSAKELENINNTLMHNNIKIQYFEPSTKLMLDSAKIKQDNLYNKYAKLVNVKEYVKITVI